MTEFIKRLRKKDRLPALVLVLGIALALSLSVISGQSEPALARIYISPQPPGAVSFNNVIQITEADIGELNFLADMGEPTKIRYKGEEEFYIYTSHDGFHFAPLYLTRPIIK